MSTLFPHVESYRAHNDALEAKLTAEALRRRTIEDRVSELEHAQAEMRAIHEQLESRIRELDAMTRSPRRVVVR
jgi:hypothetical protein